MENKFNINEVKSLNAILFVLESLGGHCDFHKIFKILYFADQKHLALFGLPITGDNYIAMKDGPVPSRIYDIFKSLRGEITDSINLQTYNEVFKIDNRHIVSGKIKADIEELSESNIECLTASIELTFYRHLDNSYSSTFFCNEMMNRSIRL